MIFSIFSRRTGRGGGRGRESEGDTALGTRPAQSGPATTALTLTDPRELARRTAAKIDAIESEMITARGESTRSGPTFTETGRAGAVFVPTARGSSARLDSRVSSPAPQLETRPAPLMEAEVPQERPDLEFDSPGVPVLSPRQALPSSQEPGPDSLSIEIADSTLPAAFEEAAVLYSNGQSDDAQAILSHSILDQSLGAHARQAWAMLLDLHQARGQREAFEQLAIEYAARFETSPPSWDDSMALPEPPAATPGAPSVVALPAMLDAQAVKQFEQVKRFAQRGRAVTLDVLPVKDADAIGADLMLRVLAAFIKGGFEMSVVGVESLLTVLARTTETGRRDPSEACWMLQIELLRLLGREAAFEDMAIDYCVTYEVSPPSWEPMPATLVAVASGSMRASAWAAGPSVLAGDDAVELIGNLEGRIQDVLLALREHAADRREVVVQCRRLVRVDFGAAGELLNEIVALKAAGKYLRLRDVNHLVAALLSVMGIPELADVRLRRL